MHIRDIVARRSDLGTFLVHLTKDGEEDTARDCLISIIKNMEIEARSPFGQAIGQLKRDQKSTESQKCVCFTETPLEQLHMLHCEIDNRSFKFEPYGIGITKKQGRTLGLNPIWYIDITPGHDWLTNPFNALIDRAINEGDFDTDPISKIAPFVEQMGSGGKSADYRKEFWWEREWRHQGSFSIPRPFFVICPEEDIDFFEDLLEEVKPATRARCIGANWGLEQIIGRLAGFAKSEIEIL